MSFDFSAPLAFLGGFPLNLHPPGGAFPPLQAGLLWNLLLEGLTGGSLEPGSLGVPWLQLLGTSLVLLRLGLFFYLFRFPERGGGAGPKPAPAMVALLGQRVPETGKGNPTEGLRRRRRYRRRRRLLRLLLRLLLLRATARPGGPSPVRLKNRPVGPFRAGLRRAAQRRQRWEARRRLLRRAEERWEEEEEAHRRRWMERLYPRVKLIYRAGLKKHLPNFPLWDFPDYLLQPPPPFRDPESYRSWEGEVRHLWARLLRGALSRYEEAFFLLETRVPGTRWVRQHRWSPGTRTSRRAITPRPTGRPRLRECWEAFVREVQGGKRGRYPGWVPRQRRSLWLPTPRRLFPPEAPWGPKNLPSREYFSGPIEVANLSEFPVRPSPEVLIALLEYRSLRDAQNQQLWLQAFEELLLEEICWAGGPDHLLWPVAADSEVRNPGRHLCWVGRVGHWKSVKVADPHPRWESPRSLLRPFIRVETTPPLRDGSGGRPGTIRRRRKPWVYLPQWSGYAFLPPTLVWVKPRAHPRDSRAYPPLSAYRPGGGFWLYPQEGDSGSDSAFPQQFAASVEDHFWAFHPRRGCEPWLKGVFAKPDPSLRALLEQPRLLSFIYRPGFLPLLWLYLLRRRRWQPQALLERLAQQAELWTRLLEEAARGGLVAQRRRNPLLFDEFLERQQRYLKARLHQDYWGGFCRSLYRSSRKHRVSGKGGRQRALRNLRGRFSPRRLLRAHQAGLRRLQRLAAPSLVVLLGVLQAKRFAPATPLEGSGATAFTLPTAFTALRSSSTHGVLLLEDFLRRGWKALNPGEDNDFIHPFRGEPSPAPAAPESAKARPPSPTGGGYPPSSGYPRERLRGAAHQPENPLFPASFEPSPEDYFWAAHPRWGPLEPELQKRLSNPTPELRALLRQQQLLLRVEGFSGPLLRAWLQRSQLGQGKGPEGREQREQREQRSQLGHQIWLRVHHFADYAQKRLQPQAKDPELFAGALVQSLSFLVARLQQDYWSGFCHSLYRPSGKRWPLRKTKTPRSSRRFARAHWAGLRRLEKFGNPSLVAQLQQLEKHLNQPSGTSGNAPPSEGH